MWGPGGIYEAYPFRDAYLIAGGNQWVGSASKMEFTWDICAGSGPYRTISGCPTQFGDIHTQTFRGWTGNWRSAMINAYRGSDGPVYWVSRAIFAAYTNLWNGSQEWSYRLGAPTGNNFLVYSDVVRQNFEGGFMLWNMSGCIVQGYYPGGGFMFQYSGSNYCDNGGGLAYPGYGSDGD